jgi:hypothetical protein
LHPLSILIYINSVHQKRPRPFFQSTKEDFHSEIGFYMAVYRFPLSSGVGERVHVSRFFDLPSVVSIMHAGEVICDAELETDAYVCDLSEEYAAKLSSGKLDHVFVYEPPLVGKDADEKIRRELVSILLVGAPRNKGNS